MVIVIIAVFFTATSTSSHWSSPSRCSRRLGFLQRFRGESWLWYVPLSLGAWWAMHESGVHATVAGVAMGLLDPGAARRGRGGPPAERLEHVLGPFSAGLAVPFFALMAAGVSISGSGDLLTDPVVLGVLAASWSASRSGSSSARG